MKISQAIESYLIASNLREENEHQEKKFYVSDMGKCQRMRFLKRKGIKTEFSPFVYWIFAMGNMIHDYGYKALEAQGILLQTEETLDKMEHWSGRWDGKVKGEKLPTIFDFKSAGQYQIKKVMAGADNDENIQQILTYVKLCLDKGDKISDSGIIVYLNKEPNDLIPQIAFEREYHLTNTRAKQITEEMDTMENFWLEDKIPSCTCPAWMKNYNSYQPFCEMPEKNIKKFLKLLDSGIKIVSTKTEIVEINKEGQRRTAK